MKTGSGGVTTGMVEDELCPDEIEGVTVEDASPPAFTEVWK
jgi:hypothetical protein